MTLASSFPRLGIVASLALLVAVAGGRAADPMNFLPDDCHLIVVSRIKEQLNSQAYKEIQKLSRDLGAPVQDVNQMKDTMGLDPDNVLLVTAGMSLGKLEELAQQLQQPNPLPPLIMVADTVKPVSAADIKASIKGKQFTEVKVGSFTMHKGQDLAFCVVDKLTVVYGPPGQLQAALARNKPAKLGESMTRAYKEMANPKSTAIAVGLKELLARQEVQQAIQGAGNPQFQQFANDLEGAVLQINLGQDLDVGLSVLMKTNKSAEELRKLADGFVALAKLGAGQDVPKEAIEVIDSIKLVTKGSTVQGSLAIKTATLSKLIKEAAKRQGLQ